MSDYIEVPLYPDPLSLSSAFLTETLVDVSRRPPHMEAADIGIEDLNPPAVALPRSPTSKPIFSFPSVIPGMNVGEWQSRVSSTLMVMPSTP